MAQSVESFETDQLHEECGVFGVIAPGAPVAEMTYVGLQALQQRGEAAAGIAVPTANRVLIEKNTGLVTEALRDGGRTLGRIANGNVAVGHVRYATSGTRGDGFADAHPFGFENYRAALVHNGDVHYMPELSRCHGVKHDDDPSDTEALTRLADFYATKRGGVAPGLEEFLPQVEGAYSLGIAEQRRLIAACDGHRFRPLSIGRLANGYVMASEIPAIEAVGGTFLRDVEPGEMVVMDEHGLSSIRLDVPVDPKGCAFEYAYLARADGRLWGQNVHLARERMGKSLAEDYPVDADIVVGVPDSGMAAAIGYSRESGIPFELGITKNRYSTRTFIQEGQDAREMAAQLKYHVNRDVVEGKRLVVIDDSIVRGTTLKVLVELLRRAGAEEVHVRVPSGEYRYPCHYGMDTGRAEELLANRMAHAEKLVYLDIDSLGHLSPKRLEQAIAQPVGSLCMACMTGEYPESNVHPNNRRRLPLVGVR